MATYEESIEVHVPLTTAYNQWTQFEEFPHFMDGVESVKQLDDKTLHWVGKVGGQRREWDAQITEQTPDQRIAWTSIGGEAKNGGVVTFHKITDDTTRIMLQMEHQPEGAMEKVGELMGSVKRQVQNDLKRFKEFIETRGRETGAWRGEIKDRKVG